jgi:hypothetical protein
VSLLSGCAPYPTGVPDEYYVDVRFSAAQRAVIEDVADQWCEKAGYCPTEGVWSDQRNNGAIRLVTHFARHDRPQFSCAFESSGGVLINADDPVCVEDLHIFWRVVAHEWGHMSGIEGHHGDGLMSARPDAYGPMDLSDL